MINSRRFDSTRRLLGAFAQDLRDLWRSAAGRRASDRLDGLLPPGFKAMAAAGFFFIAAAGLQVRVRGPLRHRTHLHAMKITYAGRN